MSLLPKVNSSADPRNIAMKGDQNGDWHHRLSIIVETMREMSLHTDPQAMVRSYIARTRELRPVDRMVSLSRRGLQSPQYRITRSSLWQDDIDPWKQKERLPVLTGGLLGELVYGDQPRMIDDLQISPNDPAAEYFADQRSLVAIPHYDEGVALNMVVLMRGQQAAFDPQQFPEMVWMSNLFGRATHNLVLSEQLKRAYEEVDYELKVVADIQRALLPAELPKIATMGLAAHYQTSRRAGGDYYDFFELPDGKWGIMIADVSGHGTPAAVVMAILQTIVHAYPFSSNSPGKLLEYLNSHLMQKFMVDNGTFVTVFYAIYDPASRSLTYVSAGHNPPRVKHCSQKRISSLDRAQTLPLGILPEVEFPEHTERLTAGDQIIFYTDGITEARDATSRMFGVERLDQTLENCCLDADGLINAVLEAVDSFTAGHPAEDDRTILVAKIS